MCVISSDEYAPFAAVLVRSVIANISADKNYDIVILSDDMLQRNRLRIEAMADGLDNVSVRVMDISDIIKDFHFYTWAHFTPNTYYRLLAPDLFKAYKKVLYLDSDIVVNHDVAELYATDLDGYMMAAAYDTHVAAYCTQNPPLEQREYNMKTLGLKNPEHMVTLANKIIEKDLSVRDVEKTIRLFNYEPENAMPQSNEEIQKKSYIKDIERRALSAIGRKVKIVQSPKKKVLEVSYSDDEDLEDLLRTLCGKDFFPAENDDSYDRKD